MCFNEIMMMIMTRMIKMMTMTMTMMMIKMLSNQCLRNLLTAAIRDTHYYTNHTFFATTIKGIKHKHKYKYKYNQILKKELNNPFKPIHRSTNSP